MINEIAIGNGTGNSVTIGNDPAKDYDFVLDSVDWDTPAVTMNTYHIPNQIGASLNGVTVGTRKPMIAGYVVANTKKIDMTGLTWEEYYKKQLEMIEVNKEKLNSIISVMRDVVIRANNYVLDGRPSLPPKYATDEKRNNEVMCYFELNFECFDPLFHTEVSDKLEMPNHNTEYTVNNDGQATIGMRIAIDFTGTVEKPTFTNATRGETVKVEKTFAAGDRITIVTKTGDENIYIERGGIGYPHVYLASVDSKFPKLQVGNNRLSFSAASGASNMNVKVTYMKEFYTLKEM